MQLAPIAGPTRKERSWKQAVLPKNPQNKSFFKNKEKTCPIAI